MKCQRTAETESASNQFGYEKIKTKYDTNQLSVLYQRWHVGGKGELTGK